jgi:selenocysteine lyase/cysteine desulfurase
MEAPPTSDETEAYLASVPRRQGLIPLNNAAMSPLNRKAAEAMTRSITELMHPDASSREGWLNDLRSAHATFADLLDCDPHEVTFMPNVACAMSAIANALKLGPDDEIVTVDQEYGSNAYPWHETASRTGASVVLARSRDDGSIDTRCIAALIGQKTRIVAVSWVQFQTGVAVDLHALTAACERYGALLVVDTTQGVGVAPFSMKRSGVDVIAGSMHKWLGGPPGLAYLAIRQDRVGELEPLVVGPYSYGDVACGYDADAKPLPSAARFRSGTPPLIAIAGSAAAARVALDFGIGNVSERALSLAVYLRQSLETHGHRVISPAAMTSPIVTFVPRQGLEAGSRKLASRGVSFALRGGGLRLSPHAFNTRSDIETAVEALAAD